MEKEGGVRTESSNGVGIIEFFHPQSNCLPGKLLESLENAITEMGKNSDISVIVLRSGGEKAFCGGASFDELMAIKDVEGGRKFFSGFANVINACRKCSKLIIGRIQGKAVGGGVGLASAVDYCLATEAASVKLSELAVGIGPFVVGPAVERKMGMAAMSHLSINATEFMPASWAREKGLYNSIHAGIAELDEAVNNLVVKLSKSNPQAMMELKQIFWKGTEHWDDLLKDRAGISGRLVLSDFTRNAILAFKSGK